MYLWELVFFFFWKSFFKGHLVKGLLQWFSVKGCMEFSFIVFILDFYKPKNNFFLSFHFLII